jgi:hypothetical protein
MNCLFVEMKVGEEGIASVQADVYLRNLYTRVFYYPPTSLKFFTYLFSSNHVISRNKRKDEKQRQALERHHGRTCFGLCHRHWFY